MPMEVDINKACKQLWLTCGKIDLANDVSELEKDITKFSQMINPCRQWLSERNKLANIKKHPNSYTLKEQAEFDIGEWVPHSVFILSAFLEGFKLSSSVQEAGAYVVSTNIGAKRRGA
jgi:hypothetical protein